MMLHILKSMDQQKTQKCKYLDNETIYFLEINFFSSIHLRTHSSQINGKICRANLNECPS